jgi:hypothetical protein
MSDAFADAFALLAAAADVPGCKARLAEMKKQLDAIEKARAQFEADRAAAVADKAAADEREKTLRDREVAVALGERILNNGREELAAARRAMTVPPIYVGASLTQEPYTNG